MGGLYGRGGGIQFPLLWSLVVDRLLRGLKNGCCTLGYTDDIAIRTSGKFLNTISELLQALVWYTYCDGTWFCQFIKDGVVLFTRRRDLRGLNEPNLYG